MVNIYIYRNKLFFIAAIESLASTSWACVRCRTQEVQVGIPTSTVWRKLPGLPVWVSVEWWRFVLSRDAAKEEKGAGHISGLCAWRREPGWVEAQRRQSHRGAPMGAGENGAAAWGGSLKSLIWPARHVPAFSPRGQTRLDLSCVDHLGGEDPPPTAAEGETGWC